MKALQILINIDKGEYPCRPHLHEAIAELEELIKPKSCNGCKYETENKYVSVQDETLDCCCVCIRECYDFYEPKENK